jgi:hypothetical protein
MTTLNLVVECLTALKDRTGSSVPAISKWIEAEKKVSRIERENGSFSRGESC